MSDYIQTTYGRKNYPLKAFGVAIHIEDIAHALSMMTRAKNCFGHFYSVAQDSISCYKEAAIAIYKKYKLAHLTPVDQ